MNISSFQCSDYDKKKIGCTCNNPVYNNKVVSLHSQLNTVLSFQQRQDTDLDTNTTHLDLVH